MFSMLFKISYVNKLNVRKVEIAHFLFTNIY